MDPYIGEIKLVPYNFAPVGWMFCQGQLLSIADNEALYSLIGTTYGGDGVTQFALPNLQGKVVVSAGPGPGLSTYTLGEQIGQASVHLTTGQIPAHSHKVSVNNAVGTLSNPTGNFLAVAEPRLQNVYTNFTRQTNPGQPLLPNGADEPHENRQPFLVLNYVIAVEGVFPQQG